MVGNDDFDLPAPLRENVNDFAASALRGVLGSMPVGGALVAELVGRIIPNLREERFIAYVAKLARKVEDTQQSLEKLLNEVGAEKAALFEDGANGAVRATTEGRIEQLAQIVAEGLKGTEREAEDQRSLVRLLNELTEADLRYLMLWTKRYGDDREWRKENGYNYTWEKQGDALVPTGDAMDNIVEFYIQGRLISMGLMRNKVTQTTETGRGRRERFEHEAEMADEGLSLLRRLNLLGPDET